jgi:ABC-type transport system substrate-binding protein
VSSIYDRAVRQHIYSFVQRQLIADLPYDFLWQMTEVDVIPPSLHGYKRPEMISPYYPAARWHW